MKECRLTLPAHDVMSKHDRIRALLLLHFARPFLGLAGLPAADLGGNARRRGSLSMPLALA